MHDELRKSARLEARLSRTLHELLLKAATLQGRSLSEFVLAAAQRAAEDAVAKAELLELCRTDQERFVTALLQPAEPSPALKRAARAHRELIDPS